MIDCLMCAGAGGWNPTTGEPRTKPTPMDPGAWHRCPYCNGERRCPPPPDMSGFRRYLG